MPRRCVYGKLPIKENLAAYEIWRKRLDEPVLSEPIYVGDGYCFDDSPLIARELWQLAEESLNDRDRAVLIAHHVMGLTFAEIGSEIGVTPARARQLEMRAIRRAKKVLNEQNVFG